VRWGLRAHLTRFVAVGVVWPVVAAELLLHHVMITGTMRPCAFSL
jgi:hypothetical protein